MAAIVEEQRVIRFGSCEEVVDRPDCFSRIPLVKHPYIVLVKHPDQVMGERVAQQDSIDLRTMELGKRARIIREARVAHKQSTIHAAPAHWSPVGVRYLSTVSQRGSMVATVEAKLETHLEGLGLDHPATQAAVSELMADLRGESELRPAEREVGEHGSKGAVVELVVSLGTPGSIVGLARILQLWLSRDRRRSLTVSVRKSSGETQVTIDGRDISNDVVTNALRSAVEPNGEPA